MSNNTNSQNNKRKEQKSWHKVDGTKICYSMLFLTKMWLEVRHIPVWLWQEWLVFNPPLKPGWVRIIILFWIDLFLVLRYILGCFMITWPIFFLCYSPLERPILPGHEAFLFNQKIMCLSSLRRTLDHSDYSLCRQEDLSKESFDLWPPGKDLQSIWTLL